MPHDMQVNTCMSNRPRQTHQIILMYSLRGDRHGGTWRELAAAVPAAGGPSAAVAAAERAGAQRSARGRAVRAGGPAPEPGLLPPAPAARRWSCVDASQRRRRPRHLLRPRSGALRRAADRAPAWRCTRASRRLRAHAPRASAAPRSRASCFCAPATAPARRSPRRSASSCRRRGRARRARAAIPSRCIPTRCG